MPFSFPASPTVGQQSTQNSRVYQWTGSAWELVASATTFDAGNLTGTVATARLPASGVTAGTYTSVTVDATGRVTAGSSPAVAYSSLTGTPATFAPAAHSQAWSTITSTPTTLLGYGITDAANVSHTHSAADITSGTIDTDRLGTGTASASTYLRGDRTWATITSYSLPNATASTLGGVIVGTGLGVTSGTVSVSYGTTSGTACVGNDSRLSDARTATAHASSHASGGSDAISVAASQITSGSVAVARLPTVLEQVVAGGNTSTAVTLSLSSGSVQTWTLNNNCTFTMPTASAGASLTIFLTQSATNTATFTAVKWSGGTAPTITATASKIDVLVFVSDGTYWYGSALQNF